jgi:Holliday junction resolvase RusA-like endonuclease
MTPYGAGRPIVRNGENYYRCRDIRLKQSDERLYNHWVSKVRAQALAAGAPPQPLDGPWRVECWFYFHAPDRPMHPEFAIGGGAKTTDPKTGRRQGGNIADTDKLLRTVLDALEGVFWTNDKRVADCLGHKRYSAENGARLQLRYLTEEQLSLLGG